MNARSEAPAGASGRGFGVRRVTARDDLTEVRALLAGYESAVAEQPRREYGVLLAELSPGADLLTEIESVRVPPNVLYMADCGERAIGTGALKNLGEGVGEIKRM